MEFILKATLSASERAMMDGLEQNSADVDIGQGSSANYLGGAACGRTTKYEGSKDSQIELWLSGTDAFSQSVLLHELVHSSYIIKGDDPGHPLSESDAYGTSDAFRNRSR